MALFLKKLEIFGFKSFAEKTVIDFQGGISAILGPNGCGKSNVVDAVKWVLGEQAVRSIRAEKMEDVIFSGNENRKPLNVAEATLIFANDNSLLPLASAEVAVKRRYFRNGESDYFINGNKARLKDVRELFFDTGIGKVSYSIMEQGKIDQILSNKPEERRFLFEEAAGITRLKARGREAVGRLQKSEENIAHLSDIFNEVENSYKNLRDQAEKAAKYRQYKEEIFNIEIDLQLLRLRKLLLQETEREQECHNEQIKLSESKEKLKQLNDFLSNHLSELNQMEKELIAKQKELYKTEAEGKSLSTRKAVLTERQREAAKQLADFSVRIDEQNRLTQELERQRLESAAGIETLCGEMEQLEENIGNFQTTTDNAQKDIRQNENEIKHLEQQARSDDAANRQLQTKLKQLTEEIVAEIDATLKEGNYSARQRQELEEWFNATINNLQAKINKQRQLIAGWIENSVEKSDQAFNSLPTLLDNDSRIIAETLDTVQKRLRQFFLSLPTLVDTLLAPEGTITRKREIDSRMEQIAVAAERKRNNAARLSEENQQLSQQLVEYRQTLQELRLAQVKNQAKKEQLQRDIERTQREKRERLNKIEQQKKEQSEFRVIQQERQQSLELVAAEFDKQKESEKKLRDLIDKMEKSILAKNQQLGGKQRQLSNANESHLGRQRRADRAQGSLDMVKHDITTLRGNFSERFSRDIKQYEQRTFEIKEDRESLQSKLRQWQESLAELGQVNLMAAQECEEVGERYNFLDNQLADMRKARQDLLKITELMTKEATELFLETYDKIKKNFHTVFRRLFNGGRAELKMADQDVLQSGIEIFVQPPGKKHENITLLSGGERTLAAIALLFATYMVKPSPFCILDEIDAALDDNNIQQFVDMLSMFADKSQFMIISHNKRTVANASSLIGVTMEESGVSKVVALRIEKNSEKGVNA